MQRTVRLHLAQEKLRTVNSAITTPSADAQSGSSSGTRTASPENDNLERDFSPAPYNDDEDDDFDFDPDSGASANNDFQWLADDSDDPAFPSSPSPFLFSSDSEQESGFEAEGNDDDDDSDGQDTAPDGEFYIEEITSDPLFRSRSTLFDAFQPEHDDPDDETSAPWAFDDHPAIRNAYIRAFVGAAFEGMTRKAVVLMLEGALVAFQSAQKLGVDYPGISNFARTLPTVEKRLGLSTDDFIIYLFICDVCWKPHFPKELATLETPDCDQPNCSGHLYTVKRLSNGSEKRTPILTLPFVPPGKAIQRMCLQPGKVAQWQEWRGPDDIVGQREPSELQGFAAFSDPDRPLTDISDGWGWRAVQAGLQRRRNGVWEIQDVDVDELKQQFVALPNGLIIQINIDW